jgi:hypothetical protein
VKEFEEQERRLKNAIELLADFQHARNVVREQSKSNYGLLLDAHLCVMGVISTLIYKKNGVPGKTNESISGRLSLVSSFLQGIDLCETSISEGLYSQAAALLKQQMETVAAMEEYASGKRMNKKTPNVKEVRFNLSRWYGDLNGAAHVSDQTVMHALFQAESFEDAVPTSIMPIYHIETSRSLFAMHVSLLIHFAHCLGKLHSEMYNEGLDSTDYLMLASALRMIEEEGFIMQSPQPSD